MPYPTQPAEDQHPSDDLPQTFWYPMEIAAAQTVSIPMLYGNIRCHNRAKVTALSGWGKERPVKNPFTLWHHSRPISRSKHDDGGDAPCSWARTPHGGLWVRKIGRPPEGSINGSLSGRCFCAGRRFQLSQSLLKGGELADVTGELGALALILLVISGIAMLRYRQTLD